MRSLAKGRICFALHDKALLSSRFVFMFLYPHVLADLLRNYSIMNFDFPHFLRLRVQQKTIDSHTRRRKRARQGKISGQFKLPGQRNETLVFSEIRK
jgi:hypothetical protein